MADVLSPPTLTSIAPIFILRQALALLVLGSGCAGFTQGVLPDGKYHPASAYVYGRFFVDAERHALSLAGHQSIGFAIRCRDGATYTIGFSNQTPLQIIRVVPSKCQLDDIVYTDDDGRVVARRMASFRLLRNEILEPGGVYYVGDFVAAARSRASYKIIYTEIRSSWAVGRMANNYDKTTEDLKRTFPDFAWVPTENRMSR